MSCSQVRPGARVGGFAVWRAGWRYVAFWIVKVVTGSVAVEVGRRE
jgi:hypothetical protein